MIPDGMKNEDAQKLLQQIKQEAREALKNVPHDGNDTDRYIAVKWHEACGKVYVETERAPPPPEPVPVPKADTVDIPFPNAVNTGPGVLPRYEAAPPPPNAVVVPGEKVPDVDPMDSVNAMAPPGPPPAPAMRTA